MEVLYLAYALTFHVPAASSLCVPDHTYVLPTFSFLSASTVYDLLPLVTTKRTAIRSVSVIALKVTFEFLGAELAPGAGIVMEAVGLEAHIREADIVLTGEGRTDAQTAMGKAPAAVAELAKRYDKPVIVFCGSKGPGAENCFAKGIDAIFPILREPSSLAEAMDPEKARLNLTDAAEQVFRVIALGL